MNRRWATSCRSNSALSSASSTSASDSPQPSSIALRQASYDVSSTSVWPSGVIRWDRQPRTTSTCSGIRRCTTSTVAKRPSGGVESEACRSAISASVGTPDTSTPVNEPVLSARNDQPSSLTSVSA